MIKGRNMRSALTEKKIQTPSSLWAWMICSLGAIFYSYEYFLRITPSVITPELMATYHLTGAEIGSLSAFYYHAYMPMQLVVGILMDRFGPRRLLTLACLFCAIGTFLFASSSTITIAALGRFLVGFGSAFAFVGALKLATIWLPANRFALISGIITSLGMIGAMAGDIILRSLIDVIGWRHTLYFSAVLGVGLTLILWLFVRDTKNHKLETIVSPIPTKELIIKLGHALKNPQIWMIGLIGFILYLSLSAFGEMWGIPYLDQGREWTKSQAANVNSLIFLGWAIGGPIWGWISEFVEQRRTLIIIGSLVAIVIILSILYLPHLSFFTMGLLFFLFGLFSSVQVIIFAIARDTGSIHMTGTTVALINMLVMLGGNIFQPVIGKLLDLSWAGTMEDGARLYSLSAFQFALSILPIGMMIAVIVAFFIREKNRDQIQR